MYKHMSRVNRSVKSIKRKGLRSNSSKVMKGGRRTLKRSNKSTTYKKQYQKGGSDYTLPEQCQQLKVL